MKGLLVIYSAIKRCISINSVKERGDLMRLGLLACLQGRRVRTSILIKESRGSVECLGEGAGRGGQGSLGVSLIGIMWERGSDT